MSQTPTQSTPKRVDVFASLPMEAHLRSLKIYDGFNFPGDNRVSQETQQLEEAKQLDVLIAHHEDLRKLLKAEKPTGIPHLFVLDPEALAVGDMDAQTTLHALANTQFSDSSLAVAAMLPPSTGYTPAGKLTASLLKDTILTDAGVVTLESVEALSDWLTQLRRPFGGDWCPALESMNQQGLKELAEAAKVHTHPFTKEEIDFVSQKMGQTLPKALLELYREIGHFHHKGFSVLTAHMALDATSYMVRDWPHLPHTYLIIATKVLHDKPDVHYKLIVDLKTARITAFSENSVAIPVPKIPLLDIIKGELKA